MDLEVEAIRQWPRRSRSAAGEEVGHEGGKGEDRAERRGETRTTITRGGREEETRSGTRGG